MYDRKDWILGVCSILLGVLTIMYSTRWNGMTIADPAGPAAIPRLVSFGMIVIGVIITAGSLFKRAEENTVSDSIRKTLVEHKNVFQICAVCLVYVLILKYVGYLIATPLLIGGILWVVEVRDLKRLLSVSIGTSLLLFAVFYFGLQVKLPMGFLNLI